MSNLQDLVREEGVESLYRGLSPVLTSLCASGFVYFYTFHGLRAVFGSKTGHSASRDLTLGAIAGVINVFTTTPFWVVNTRMKMQGIKSKSTPSTSKDSPHSSKDKNHHTEYKGILDGIVQISRREGTSSLWAGTIPSLVLVSNPAIQFMIYESLKRKVGELMKQEKLGSGMIFLLGAISKSISTVITYPLQVVQSKSRYGSPDVRGKKMMEIFMSIVNKDGTAGLYKGLEAKLLQTVLTTALMYLAYEKIVSFVFSVMLTRTTGVKKLS